MSRKDQQNLTEPTKKGERGSGRQVLHFQSGNFNARAEVKASKEALQSTGVSSLMAMMMDKQKDLQNRALDSHSKAEGALLEMAKEGQDAGQDVSMVMGNDDLGVSIEEIAPKAIKLRPPTIRRKKAAPTKDQPEREGVNQPKQHKEPVLSEVKAQKNISAQNRPKRNEPSKEKPGVLDLFNEKLTYSALKHFRKRYKVKDAIKQDAIALKKSLLALLFPKDTAKQKTLLNDTPEALRLAVEELLTPSSNYDSDEEECEEEEDFVNFSGTGAIHLMSALGYQDLMGLFFEKGMANVGEKHKTGLTPLHAAVLYRRTNIVKYLVEEKKAQYTVTLPIIYTIHGVEKAIQSTALDLAIILGHSEIVHYAIDKESALFDMKSNMGNILHTAIYARQIESLRILLAYLAENTTGGDFYNEAISKLFSNQLKAPLTPLSLAAYKNNFKAIALLNRCSQVEKDKKSTSNNTALHYAVLGKSVSAVRMLMELEVDYNVRNGNGNTADAIANERSGQHGKYQIISNIMDDRRRSNEGKKLEPPNFSKTPPENLYFKGGGTKVLAYIGAYEKLIEKLPGMVGKNGSLKRVAGASGGAITAMMVALGIPLEKLSFMENSKAMLGYDFGKSKVKNALSGVKLFSQLLLQARARGQSISALWSCVGLGWIAKLIKGGLKIDGVFKTHRFRDHMDSLIQAQLKADGVDKDTRYGAAFIKNLTFGGLKQLVEDPDPKYSHYRHLYVVTIGIDKVDRQLYRINSEDKEWADIIISDAVVASSSIPGVFVPHELHIKRNGRRIGIEERHVDGGMIRNYYVSIFDSAKYVEPHKKYEKGYNPQRFNKRTLSLSLHQKTVGEQKTAGFMNIGKATMSILTGDLVETAEKANKARTIWIDIGDMGTLDAMAAKKKGKLIASAKKDVVRFFDQYKQSSQSDTQENKSINVIESSLQI